VTQAGCGPVDFGIGVDDEGVSPSGWRRPAGTCDAVVTSGGVVDGDYDMVKIVLPPDRRDEVVAIAIKPAKPLAFGMIGGRPVFGLPGNPVSSHVACDFSPRRPLPAE